MLLPDGGCWLLPTIAVCGCDDATLNPEVQRVAIASCNAPHSLLLCPPRSLLSRWTTILILPPLSSRKGVTMRLQSALQSLGFYLGLIASIIPIGALVYAVFKLKDNNIVRGYFIQGIDFLSTMCVFVSGV